MLTEDITNGVSCKAVRYNFWLPVISGSSTLLCFTFTCRSLQLPVLDTHLSDADNMKHCQSCIVEMCKDV